MAILGGYFWAIFGDILEVILVGILGVFWVYFGGHFGGYFGCILDNMVPL